MQSADFTQSRMYYDQNGISTVHNTTCMNQRNNTNIRHNMNMDACMDACIVVCSEQAVFTGIAKGQTQVQPREGDPIYTDH